MTWTRSDLSRRTVAKTETSGRSAWTKADIRNARKKPLPPILQARGMALKPMPAGNFLLVDCDDLIVKQSYWRWPSRNLDGNAIDFFMTVEGKTFNQAMQILSSDRFCEASAKEEALCEGRILTGTQQALENRSELPS